MLPSQHSESVCVRKLTVSDTLIWHSKVGQWHAQYAPFRFSSSLILILQLASWLHLLSNVASDPQQRTSWARSGVVMTVYPVPSKGRNRVVMTCFEAPEAFCRSVSSLAHSDDWQSVLKDPYLLYVMVFEAWYEVVDNGTWNVVDLAREEETVRPRSFYLW